MSKAFLQENRTFVTESLRNGSSGAEKGINKSAEEGRVRTKPKSEHAHATEDGQSKSPENDEPPFRSAPRLRNSRKRQRVPKDGFGGSVAGAMPQKSTQQFFVPPRVEVKREERGWPTATQYLQMFMTGLSPEGHAIPAFCEHPFDIYLAPRNRFYFILCDRLNPPKKTAGKSVMNKLQVKEKKELKSFG